MSCLVTCYCVYMPLAPSIPYEVLSLCNLQTVACVALGLEILALSPLFLALINKMAVNQC